MSNRSPTKPVEPVRVPYIDEERDYRDSIVCEALSAAIQLIEEDDDPGHVLRTQALGVLRLARLSLSDNSKHTAEINAEVNHG